MKKKGPKIDKGQCRKILIFGGSIFIFLFLFILIYPSDYTNFTFNFYVEETGEKLNGELFINNISLGVTEEGKITILVEDLSNVVLFEFRVFYEDNFFNFTYDFSQDLLNKGEQDFIVYEEQLKIKTMNFLFYDNKTNCKLNGKVYVDDFFIGDTQEGAFLLTEKEYNQKFKINSTIHIFGRTDFCFEKDANLPFAGYWSIHDLKYFFDNNETLEFDMDLDPRWPKYYVEIQDFVRPEETRSYLEDNLKKYFKNNTWEDLDVIANYMRISYISDQNRFKKSEYWQTPAEVLRIKMGDCEDWAITTLSLMREYNNSVNCYNILWPTHLSILCYKNNHFAIYDQGRTKFSTALEIKNINDSGVMQDNKIAIRKMRNDYFDWYGLNPNERRMYALFNENELITFEKDEDFVNWAINLIEEKN